MKSMPLALCGVTLSLAITIYVVVRRSQRGSVITTVFVKDEAHEAARLASDQEFADDALVQIQELGTGRVIRYIPSSTAYTVEVVEHGKTQHKTVPANHINSIKVKELYVYPIKSCRGIRLENAVITARGIANDRSWMVVDQKGKFITMRRYHKMALIVPQLDDLENPTVLTLTAPGMDDLRVPIVRKGVEIPTQVWSTAAIGIDQGAAAARWLNKFLGDVRGERELRLIRIKDSVRRPTNPKYAPQHEIAFADAYPYLLAVDASVDDLNKKLQDKITIDCFRANIIVTGAPPYADEHWHCITIGALRFRNVKPCDRCKVPTVDPTTGIAHAQHEPQKTMTPFRNGVALGFKNGSEHAYYFGSNLVAEDLGGLAVGVPVKILTTKEIVFA